MNWGDLPLSIYGLTLLVSFFLTGAIFFTRRFHISLTARSDDHLAVQAAHQVPTPRIGGVAIVVALILALLALDGRYAAPSLAYFAVAIVPVFAIGLLEDLGIPMRPRYRLAAAAVSSALMIVLLERYLPRLDVSFLDTLLAFTPFAALFTIFATTGVCHAINLIDGLNGLSSTVSVVIAVALAMIAGLAGDTAMVAITLCVVPAILGFLVFNFPRGLIFLGDGGAYSIGHVLSWLAIIIVWRNPEVSPWAVLLVFFWPVCDTILSVYRRKRLGKPTDQPDRLHYHQLVMRFLEIVFLNRNKRTLANPLATMVIVPLASVPALMGALFWNDSLVSGLLAVGFVILFVGSYNLGLGTVRGARELRRRRVRPAPIPAGE